MSLIDPLSGPDRKDPEQVIDCFGRNVDPDAGEVSPGFVLAVVVICAVVLAFGLIKFGPSLYVWTIEALTPAQAVATTGMPARFECGPRIAGANTFEIVLFDGKAPRLVRCRDAAKAGA